MPTLLTVLKTVSLIFIHIFLTLCTRSCTKVTVGISSDPIALNIVKRYKNIFSTDNVGHCSLKSFRQSTMILRMRINTYLCIYLFMFERTLNIILARHQRQSSCNILSCSTRHALVSRPATDVPLPAAALVKPSPPPDMMVISLHATETLLRICPDTVKSERRRDERR